MSSGHFDKKAITFEISNVGVVGQFILAHLDGDKLNPDKILMKMRTNSVSGSGCSSENTTSIIINKENTKVLSHWMRTAADVMDEWYKEEK